MPTSTSRVIAIMVVIVLATAALMGADAWTRSHRARTPAPATDSLAAGAGSQASTAAPAKPTQSGWKSPFANDHGDEQVNE